MQICVFLLVLFLVCIVYDFWIARDGGYEYSQARSRNSRFRIRMVSLLDMYEMFRI